MKTLLKFIAASVAAAAVAACSQTEKLVGVRTSALDDSAWEASEWISAVNAPVLTEVVQNDHDCRSADGSSWFMATVKNGKAVKSAKWMTTGLGVYDIYLNGQPFELGLDGTMDVKELSDYVVSLF